MSRFVLFTRRCIAWPPAVLGFLLTEVGGWLVMFAAWVMEIDIERDYHE